MTTQLEQFLTMLDNVKQFSPRVYGGKNIKLAQDPHYELVEMSSSAGMGLQQRDGQTHGRDWSTTFATAGSPKPRPVRGTHRNRRMCFQS